MTLLHKTGKMNVVGREKYLTSRSDVVWGSEEFHGTLVGLTIDQCLKKLAQNVSEMIRPDP